jgi:hypothetical protein
MGDRGGEIKGKRQRKNRGERHRRRNSEKDTE